MNLDYEANENEECNEEVETKTIPIHPAIKRRMIQEAEADKPIISMDDICNLKIVIYGSKNTAEFISKCW